MSCYNTYLIDEPWEDPDKNMSKVNNNNNNNKSNPQAYVYRSII